MTQMLVAAATYDRLRDQFDALEDIDIVTLAPSGELARNGVLVSPDELRLDMMRMDVELFQTGQFELVNRLIDLTPQFGFVQTQAAGLDHPIFRQLAEKSDVFCNSDAQAPAIAEFVTASVLNRWHRFDERRDHQQAHRWQANSFRQLMDSRWLIIGFGHIGERIARQVRGFEGHVTAVRRRQAAHELADAVHSLDALDHLLPDADVVVLACALNEETRGIAGEQFFDAMARHAVLVNIGRGDLVDEKALCAALDRGELDYAILDVFRTEPLPEDSPIWDHSRIQVTPHSSSHGSLTAPRFDELFMTNLARYLTGKPVLNQVRPDTF